MKQLSVSAETHQKAEYMGRERHVILTLGNETVTMKPDNARQVAAWLVRQAEVIEDDHPSRIVFR